MSEEAEQLELRMLPGAKLAGTRSPPRGEIAPAEIGAEFRLVAPGQAHLGVEEGKARC